ncbi:hypothetical protein BKA65DRAFT_150785 [Rhexocercosporidium sp. MPI-PUGE-AT-0058]|nr:hypothetical protein BKA65DRAFT_150785 [Rhexocercosporidium sp. MPI-PUGE-AT-0058]
MPFPSKGCKTCKTRRVKCDETQPRCRRCVKADRVCYGMPPVGETNHVYHLENSFASGINKRPRGPRPRPTATVQSPPPRLITQPPSPDLKTQAVNYYIQNHLRTLKDAPDLVRAVYDFPTLWASLEEYPILNLAVSSIALAVFSRAKSHPPAALEATENYHRLLQLAQQTIFSLDEKNVDVCLLAIFFMGRYEQVVYCPTPSHLQLRFPSYSIVQSFSHHDGNLAILKSWKEHLSEKLPATDVIKRVRRGMIRSALLRNIALPEWIVDGELFGERGVELEYDRLVVRIVDIREQLTTLWKEKLGQGQLDSESVALAKELDEQARLLDLALQDWTAHFPSSWAYKRHTLSEPRLYPTKDFYSSTVLTCQSPSYAAVWNLYFGTRILINVSRVSILELAYPEDKEEQSLCFSIINDMANDLASSIPFCRQIVTVTESPDPASQGEVVTVNKNQHEEQHVGATTVWPLSMASSMIRVEVKPGSWFRAELARIGRILYDSVLEGAEREEWLQL